MLFRVILEHTNEGLLMLLFTLLLFFLLLIVIALKVFSILSGYAAKVMCSNVFISSRKPEDIMNNDLASFPFNLAKCSVDYENRSVSASVFGLARKQAIFREGLGATLINNSHGSNGVVQPTRLAAAERRDTDNIDWPNGNRLQKKDTGYDATALAAAIKLAFEEPGQSTTGTRALVVIHDGEIVAEQYAEGFSYQSKLGGWSMAKSITSALVGIFVRHKKLSLPDCVLSPEWKNDQRSSISLTHLLQMSSGLGWWEYYTAPSDVTNMLFNEGSVARLALGKKLKNKPGVRFKYSSGTTNIISYLMRQVLGEDLYHRFPYEELFYKIGMFDTVLEVDAAGTFVGSSYCYATARDWGRFGLLYLNGGIFNGEQILPKGWVDFTTTPTTGTVSRKDGNYGAHWWLNKPGRHGAKRYPNVPDDCFTALGYEGQYIWVIPSHKLVIVRLALEKRNKLEPNLFLPALIKAFRSQPGEAPSAPCSP
jgi:CubicO group peptidase (beta-lactamase class C family)